MASGKKTQEKKEPLVRLAQRQGMSTRKKWIIRILSIIVALILGAFIFMTLGYSPFSVYGSMINGSLGGKLAIQQTIKIAIPLLGASLAIAPAFKMKFWNIGVEGQITMGGIFATFFALNFAETWPSWLLILVMCVAGAIGGGGLAAPAPAGPAAQQQPPRRKGKVHAEVRALHAGQHHRSGRRTAGGDA